VHSLPAPATRLATASCAGTAPRPVLASSSVPAAHWPRRVLAAAAPSRPRALRSHRRPWTARRRAAAVACCGGGPTPRTRAWQAAGQSVKASAAGRQTREWLRRRTSCRQCRQMGAKGATEERHVGRTDGSARDLSGGRAAERALAAWSGLRGGRAAKGWPPRDTVRRCCALRRDACSADGCERDGGEREGRRKVLDRGGRSASASPRLGCWPRAVALGPCASRWPGRGGPAQLGTGQSHLFLHHLMHPHPDHDAHAAAPLPCMHAGAQFCASLAAD
jgi:hypothetical protein